MTTKTKGRIGNPQTYLNNDSVSQQLYEYAIKSKTKAANDT
jgi:hypothetical protein